eukprot:TRINITY_DN4449_c0_g1_i1.p1 TRINITY_DN4449_c0_g1~~TRINITY_DN4449_c0_g1_i1.p1  ORF type:complete len:218 (+),score=29.73 TRINITY_DN4449_c0_g1_i1:405-1058(+)
MVSFRIDLTAMDYAVLHGQYPCAFVLMKAGQRAQTEAFYKSAPGAKETIDYERMIDHLECQIDPMQAPSFIIKPVRPTTPKYVDPVPDPREPWGNFFKRVLNFEEGPMVERSELPPDLQPQNRILGRIRSYFEEPYSGGGHLPKNEYKGVQVGENVARSLNQSQVDMEKSDDSRGGSGKKSNTFDEGKKLSSFDENDQCAVFTDMKSTLYKLSLIHI